MELNAALDIFSEEDKEKFIEGLFRSARNIMVKKYNDGRVWGNYMERYIEIRWSKGYYPKTTTLSLKDGNCKLKKLHIQGEYCWFEDRINI